MPLGFGDLLLRVLGLRLRGLDCGLRILGLLLRSLRVFIPRHEPEVAAEAEEGDAYDEAGPSHELCGDAGNGQDHYGGFVPQRTSSFNVRSLSHTARRRCG